MKYRNGFVSNSSSSSFTIKVTDLTSEQLFKILNNKDEDADTWDINTDTDHGASVVTGYTSMDNYPFGKYLENIGVDIYKIKWGD